MQLTLYYYNRIGVDMIDVDIGIDIHACILVYSHAPVTIIFKSRENILK